MLIRDATHDDSPHFADIVIACWRLAYRGVIPDAALDRDTRDERIARMRRNPWPTLAAERDGRVIAMMRFSDPPRQCDAEIDGLYVHPAAGRAGVGRALLRFAAQRCAAANKHSLFIATLRDNQIGRAFYAKHGGRLVDAPPWTFEGVTYPSVGYCWDDLRALA
ncbi:MAG: GNAT family N-acetyltransferase [Myxococcota bacterium]|nr:GNAT family N-acetyltransferase [Deltaproteobacteria bacterium]MDQ3339595.1 GNAT family N-acetyltransferase [Myxococcota bacterium]